MSTHLDFLRDYSTAQIPYEDHREPAASESVAVPAILPNPDVPNPAVPAVKRRRRQNKPRRDGPPSQVIKRKEAREKRIQKRGVVEEKCRNCYFGCPAKISDEQRQVLNAAYWAMKYSEQREYVKAHTVQGKVKRRRVKGDPLGDEPADLKRAFTYKFYLADGDGELAAVCCAFFLGTLGYKNKSSTLIYRAHLPQKKVDRSGKRERPLFDAIWEDILSYAPRTYHKGAKYGPTALYLPTQLTVKIMHADFKIKQERKGGKACSYGFYYQVLNEMDVHFVEMDDFELPERPRPLSPAPPVQPTEAEVVSEVRELYQPPPTLPYYPVEYKPIVEPFPSDPYQMDYNFVPVKQEPQPEVVDYSDEEQDGDYPEEYLEQYSHSSGHEESEGILEEPKVEIIHEEYLGPYPQEPQPSQLINVAEPTKEPVKRKNVKRPAEPGVQALPEGYPPVKYPKRFIQRVSNKIKRRQSHPVMQTDCKCMFNCNAKLTQERRQRINEEYWSAGFCDQRMFVLAHTERHSVKRRRTKSEEKRKDCTYSYRLMDSSGQYHQVCAHFFLNTIGYEAKSSSIIYRAHQLELGEAIYDRRGRGREQTAREIELRESVDSDLLSYFAPEHVESGGALDLSATDLSRKKMHIEYLRRQAELGVAKPASLSYYYQRVKELKIVFAPKPEPKPRKRPKAENFPG